MAVIKTLSLAIALSLTLGAGAAFAQTCPNPNGWAYPLCDGSTAYGSQVMANFNQLLTSPHFTGYVGIGTTTPAYPLDISSGTVISLRLNGTNGNAGSNNTQLRFAGGKSGEMWALGTDEVYGNGSRDFHFYDLSRGPMLTLQAGSGNVGIDNISPQFPLDVGGDARIGGGGPGQLHIYGSTIYDTGSWLHLGAGLTTADGDMTVNGVLTTGSLRGRAGIGGGQQDNKMNFWWDGWCVYVYVDYTPFALTCPSDFRAKNAVSPLVDGSGLATIGKLRPVTYSWQNSKTSLRKGRQYGFIAQEVQSVLPDLVENTGMKTDQTPDGLLRLDYNGLIAPIVKSIQELKALNDSQAQEIKALKAEVAALKGGK